MKTNYQVLSFPVVRPLIVLLGVIAIGAAPSFALDGQVQIHDPSTIMLCDGKYYTWGTGGTALLLYAGTNGSGLYRSTDAGATWTAVPLKAAPVVHQ